MILAAGGSTRFGSPKQLLSLHGENLVQRTVRIAVDAGLDPVIVVLGAHASSIEGSLERFDKVTVAINESWQSGQASTLRVGISRAAELNSNAALVLLADQPRVDETSLKRIVDAFHAEQRIVASRYADAVGVPALFPRKYFERLLELDGDRGAAAFLRANLDAVTTIGVDEAAVDIDTPDDLKHLPLE